MTPAPKIPLPILPAFSAILIFGPIAVAVFSCSTYIQDPDLIERVKCYSVLLAVAISLLFYVGLYFLSPQKKTFVEDKNYVPTILLTAWVLYSILGLVLRQTATNPMVIVTLLAGFAMYTLVQLISATLSFDQVAPHLLTAIAFIGLVESTVTICQSCHLLPSLNASFPITGSFKNPCPMSLLLASVLPSSIAMLLCNQPPYNKAKIRLLALATFILSSIALFQTQIRSAYLAAIFASIVVIHLKYNIVAKIRLLLLSFRNSSKILIAVVATLFIFVLLTAVYKSKQPSANGRLLIWNISWNHLKQSPILGYGYSSFPARYDAWQADYFANANSRSQVWGVDIHDLRLLAGNVKTAYDEYLQLAVETGLCGLMMFLAFTISALRAGLTKVKNSKSPIYISAFAGTVALLISGLSSYPLRTIPTFLIWFVFTAILSFSNRHESDIRPRVLNNFRRRSKLSMILHTTIPTAFVIIFLFNAYSGLHLRQWILAKELSATNNHTQAKAMYEQCLPAFNKDGHFLADYAICLYANSNYNIALACLAKARQSDYDPENFIYAGNSYQQLGKLDSAAIEYIEASNIKPSLLYPNYLLARLYVSKRDTVNAIKYALAVLTAPVKVPSPKSDYIINDMKHLISNYNLPLP